MKIGLWTVGLVVLSVSLGWAAEPAAQTPPDLSQEMSDFDRNAALGAALTMRAGTPAELEEVGRLADQGVKAARETVVKHPDSPDAHYLLGSWLLYGYRVVEVHHITFDPERGERTEALSKVVQGPADSPEEGLAALKRATELAPTRADYLLDYAAALADYDRMPEAAELLRSVWAGKPALGPEEKIYAGLLLSDISAAQGRLEEAREWVYAALSLNEPGARAVARLRSLDSAQAAAAQVPPAAPEETWEEGAEEEYWPEYETEEYESEEYGTEEYQPEDYGREGYGAEEYQPEDYGTEGYGTEEELWVEEEPLWEENQESGWW